MISRYTLVNDASAHRQLALVRSSAAVAIVVGVLAVGAVTRSVDSPDIVSADAEFGAPVPSVEAFEPTARASAAPPAVPTDAGPTEELRSSFYMGEPSVF